MPDLFSEISQLLSRAPLLGNTRILAIDGPAGAGKSTLAGHLVKTLSPLGSVYVIHMDWIYAGWESALDNSLTEKLQAILNALKNRAPIDLEIYNWYSGKFDQVRQIPNSEFLVIEGVGAAQKIMRDAGATTIWIEIEPEVGMKRVLLRDGDAIAEQMQGWLKTQREYFHRDLTPESTDFSLSAT